MNKLLISILALILFCSLGLISCQNDTSLKEKELALKEKELELKEKEIALQQKSKNSNTSTSTPTPPEKKSRELRYLFAANGGMVGYFNDGTLVSCPRCDFIRTNILQMFNMEPMGTYKVLEDGSLLINESTREFPNYKDDRSWVLIDYKWNEKVPQD